MSDKGQDIALTELDTSKEARLTEEKPKPKPTESKDQGKSRGRRFKSRKERGEKREDALGHGAVELHQEACVVEKRLNDLSQKDEEKKKRLEDGKAILKWLYHPFTLFIVVAIIAVLVVRFVFPDSRWDGVEGWRWILWSTLVLMTWIFLYTLLSLIGAALTRVASQTDTRLFYYLNDMSFNVSLTVWGALQIVFKVYLIDHNHPWEEYYIRAFALITTIGGTRIIKFFVDKYLIYRLQRGQIWESLSQALFREKIVFRLVNKQKHMELKLVDTKLKSPSPSAFLKALIHVLTTPRPAFQIDVEVEESRHRDDSPETLKEAVEIADAIFDNLKAEDKGYLELSDFLPLWHNEQTPRAAFLLFDLSRNGKVSYDETVHVVYNMMLERKQLFNTLHDRENIAGILTGLTGFIYWIIMFFIGCLIFKTDPLGILLPLSAFFVGFAFITGDSLKNMWESAIFILFVRPYDVGDRITINDYPVMIVNSITLLYTIAYSPDGRQFVIPTQLLAKNMVHQHKRSHDYAVSLSLTLGYYTTRKQLEALEERIYEWMKTDLYPWKHDDWMFWVDNVEKCNVVTISIWAELRGINWQSPTKYQAPKHALWLHIQEACKELGITYHVPSSQPAQVQPVRT